MTPLASFLLLLVGCALTAADPVPSLTDLVALDPAAVQVSSTIDALCRPWTPDETRRQQQDPHHLHLVQVFANPLAAAALAHARASLPVGSMLIKAKLTSASESRIRLYTVMMKREPGYQPDAGDWEFGVLSGDGRTWIERGHLTSCMGCHADFKGHDYLSREYHQQARTALGISDPAPHPK